MHQTQFRHLREGDSFTYSNPDFPAGEGDSHWIITGADGGDVIDAECTDPGYGGEQEIFYLSQARYIHMRAVTPVYIEQTSITRGPGERGVHYEVRWNHLVLVVEAYTQARAVAEFIEQHADWPTWVSASALREELR